MKVAILFIRDVETALPACYGGAERIPADAYTHVADVEVGETDHPSDVAWEVVQNVDSRWLDDPRATLTPEGVALREANLELLRRTRPEVTLEEVGVRSMMVGDAVRVEDGRLRLCMPTGWKRLQAEAEEFVVVP